MQAVVPQRAVSVHLATLGRTIACLKPEGDGNCRLQRLLHSTASRWGTTPVDGQAVDAALAAESCEAVVGVLRLLHTGAAYAGTEVLLAINSQCAAYTGAFLALACTVRAFEVARDLVAPGQTVVIHDLQSAAGQRLNGELGIVIRFHPESGRFIVRFNTDDPPSDWKKLRAQNLAPANVANAKITRAVDGARECGRACLETVSDIFDDLLREMLVCQADDVDIGANGGGVREASSQADLAAAMWEALVCCAGADVTQLCGAGLLELCSGDGTLCAVLARHMLSCHVSTLATCTTLDFNNEQEGRVMTRVRGLQESFTCAYYGLYQPASLWGHSGADGPGDMPMASLQADLDAHIQRVATSAVHQGVLEALVDAADFHLGWALAHPVASTPPLALPVMLCRLVCAILGSTASAHRSTLRRHIQLMTPDILNVIHAFAELAALRLCVGGSVASDFLTAMRAVLDAVVAMVANGLWDMGLDIHDRIQEVALLVLRSPYTDSDPAVLASLALTFARRPVMPELLAAYTGLGEAPQAAFWQRLHARARLCCMSSEEAQMLAQAHLGEVRVQAAANGGIGGPLLQHEMSEIDSLIHKCILELPQTLNEPPPLPAQCTSMAMEGLPPSTLDDTGSAHGVLPTTTLGNGLGALGLPTLPGQQPRDGNTAPASEQPRHRTRRCFSRAEISKIRGVDPSAAPEDLRCSIDGKLLGVPLRSPYGHLFEKTTLEHWLNRCGSVCPITGQPLRAENCTEDKVVARMVVDWVKAAKAEHKRQVDERRKKREQLQAAPFGQDDPNVLQ